VVSPGRKHCFLLYTAVLAAGLVLAQAAAQACTVCMGAADNPQTQGMNMAILTLLGVTGSVVGIAGSFVGFGLLRAARAENDDEGGGP